MRLISAIAFILITSAVGFSASIYVPDHYATIQDAINNSIDRDVIIVRPGTYVENIDFLGKLLTVKSELGPEVTVIDANYYGRGVTFKTGEDPDAVIEGFTITNGNHSQGGSGINCIDYSSPTIRNNIITVNWSDFGGGINCDNLWLKMPLAKSWQLGAIPGTGILSITKNVPSGWPVGSEHPFQALVGPWGGANTQLTNLMTLTVK